MTQYKNRDKHDYFIRVTNLAFLDTLEKLLKVNISFVMSVRPFVRLEQLDSHRTDIHEIWYLVISRKNRLENSSFIKIGQELLVHFFNIYIYIYIWILLEKRCFRQSWRENHNTNFVFQNISQDRSAICADLLETARKDDTFRSSIIAGDETRCVQYDPPTKRQSEEPRDKNSPASKKPLTLPSITKTKMIAFFFRLQRCSAQEICSTGSDCKPRCLKLCTADCELIYQLDAIFIV